MFIQRIQRRGGGSLRLRIHRRTNFKRLRRCLIKYLNMKDWEIRKVNMLYSELDQLRAENAKLRDQGDRLSVLEDKLNQLVEMLQVSDKKVPKIKK